MAKGNKHSPALFEVVHGKKHFDKTAREGALRTPSWWFKGRRRMAEIGALAPAGGGTAVEDAPPPFEDGEIPPSAADPTQNPSFLAERALARAANQQSEAIVDTAGEAEAPADPVGVRSVLVHSGRPRSRPFHFAVDRNAQEFFVRVRYTTAAVAGASLVMVVALAYIAGRHVGRGPSSAMASPSAEEIAAGPINKGVLDVAPRGGSGSAATNTGPAFTSSTAAARQPAPRTGQPSSQVPPAIASSGRLPGAPIDSKTTPPAPPVNPNGKRVVGWQYILVQSYPDRKTAEDARDALVQNGIPCSVEKARKGWPPTWFSVITLTGFERASGPAYQSHMASIDKVNDRFAGKASFRRFEPMPIQWQERTD